jgi:exodeoxyribonuclease VII large subunit
MAQRVDELEARSVDTIKNMRHRIVESSSKAMFMEEKMTSMIKSMIQNWKALWERLSVELDSLSPLNVLKKGYTLCWKNDGRTLVRTVDDVTEDEEMCVAFAKGEFNCLVQSVDREKPIESRFASPVKTDH